MRIKSAHIKNVLAAGLIMIFASSFLYGQDCFSEISILTNVDTALIFINNKIVGKGNTVIKLNKGRYEVLIKQNKYSWNGAFIKDTINIDDCGLAKQLTYKLKKKTLFNSSSTVNKIYHLEFSGAEKSNEDFFESAWFKVLLGSAAAFGAAAAYFKIHADKKYDDYIKKRNSAILDEVNKLDLYSGIALSMLQINIGYLIFRFLSD